MIGDGNYGTLGRDAAAVLITQDDLEIHRVEDSLGEGAFWTRRSCTGMDLVQGREGQEAFERPLDQIEKPLLETVIKLKIEFEYLIIHGANEQLSDKIASRQQRHSWWLSSAGRWTVVEGS